MRKGDRGSVKSGKEWQSSRHYKLLISAECFIKCQSASPWARHWKMAALWCAGTSPAALCASVCMCLLESERETERERKSVSVCSFVRACACSCVHACMCVFTSVRVCVRARACVCVCVHAGLPPMLQWSRTEWLTACCFASLSVNTTPFSSSQSFSHV